MKITVNGEEKEAEPSVSVSDYVRSLGLDPETVVVELDGRILDREEYGARRLSEGSVLELIRFVGGG